MLDCLFTLWMYVNGRGVLIAGCLSCTLLSLYSYLDGGRGGDRLICSKQCIVGCISF